MTEYSENPLDNNRVRESSPLLYLRPDNILPGCIFGENQYGSGGSFDSLQKKLARDGYNIPYCGFQNYKSQRTPVLP
ncbi:unnamed protein product [Allacma fusca]|uniref:Uncharacterized protein n=1 Tax=Allacma fusca TaxID=39272 RepID=A0A8J2NQ59_9HEXA|nr:unnamed protein product [Allacma fusca]